MTYKNIKYHNSGPIGERDYEDAGHVYNTPKRPVSVGKAPTAAELKALRAKEDAVVARLAAEYTNATGFAPNGLMMGNIRSAASQEARGIAARRPW